MRVGCVVMRVAEKRVCVRLIEMGRRINARTGDTHM
jgi:hypothetical protein